MAAKKTGPVEDFLLAGAAATISKTVAAPIERVKLLVQNQGEMLKTGALETPYKGVIDCTKRTLADEGLISFWRGNLSNVVRYFPTQALNFAIKPVVKATIAAPADASYFTKMIINIISGGVAGVGSLCVVYSLDFTRTRLANDRKNAKQGGARKFNGMLDVYRKILKSDGIAGLYRGFTISAIGIFIYRGFYFGLYDSAQVLVPEALQGNFAVNFALGWIVTTTAGLASYPIDTIRRRMMMTSGEGTKYRNSGHCAVEILKNEGLPSFFRGAGANILRGIAGAGVISGFDLFKDFYVQTRYGDN